MNNSRLPRFICAALLLGPGLSLPVQGTDLMRVYELAVTSDPTFQSAASANRAAQEATPIARAGLLPSIDANASTTGNDVEVRRANILSGGAGHNRFNSSSYSINLTQPIYRKDRWIALDQARVQVDQADADYAFQRQELILRAAQRYFDVLGAADTLTFTRAEQEAFGQQLEQSQQRFEVGLIAITDVEEAKAGFDLARAQVIQAEVELDNAREALREVTGEYHESISILGNNMPLEMPVPDDIDRWTETALTQNLQLAAQRYAATRSRMEIQRVEAGHLPTLDLVGSHGREKANGGISATAARDNISNAIGFQLTVPIYSGGSVVARTRQSRHVYQQNLDDVERIRREVQRQTREAYLGVRSGISRVGALGQAVVSSESAAEAVEAGFQVGTRTTVDVLDASRDLFRAKRDLAVARYKYITDTLTLKQAAGTLEVEDLRLINSWLQ